METAGRKAEAAGGKAEAADIRSTRIAAGGFTLTPVGCRIPRIADPGRQSRIDAVDFKSYADSALSGQVHTGNRTRRAAARAFDYAS
jgi:hypothetical protein